MSASTAFTTNFEIPLEPTDLEKESDKYFCVDDIEVNNFSRSELDSTLDEIENKLSDKAYSITNKDLFSQIYSCVKHFSSLEDNSRIRLVDSLNNNLLSLLASVGKLLSTGVESDSNLDHVISIHKNALKMFVFLLYWVISKYEKEEVEYVKSKKDEELSKSKKKRGTKARRKSIIEMDSWKEGILHTLCSVLKYDNLPKLWKKDRVEDAFILLFFKISFSLMENHDNIKSTLIKEAIFKLITNALQIPSDNLQTVVSTILHMIMNDEQMTNIIVELIDHIGKNTSRATNDSCSTIEKLFVSELFREIGSLELNNDTPGTKFLSQFISTIGERVPTAILSNMSVVISHLNDESYNIRNAIIHAISRVIPTVLKQTSDENNSRNTTSENLTKKTRDQLLSILEERLQDINAYTRSKAIQCWCYLCEEKSIPLKTLPKILETVLGRLYDKTSSVRKSAIHFLSTLLENNPYGADLKLAKFTEEAASAKRIVESLPKHTEEELENLPDLEQKEIRLTRDNAFKLYLFYKEGVDFINKVHDTIPSVCLLLSSETITDVVECIDYLVKCFMFKIEISSFGLKKVLKLVWSPHQSIKDAASEAIQHIFMNAERLSRSAEECIEVAKQFTEFVTECSQSELSALECIVNMLVLKNEFSKNLFLSLLEIISPKYSEKNCIGALILLNMIATARPEALRKKIKSLIKDCFGRTEKQSFLIAHYACKIFQKMAIDDSSDAYKAEEKKKSKASSTADNEDMLRYAGGNDNFKLTDDHKLFEILLEYTIDKEQHFPIYEWMILAESAITTIYSLCMNPEQLSAHIIKQVSLNTNLSGSNNEADSQTLAVSPVELTKLFFILGTCAIQELVHLERQFKKAKELNKTANIEKQQKASSKKSKKSSSKKKRDRSEIDKEEEEDSNTTVIEKELGLDPSNMDIHSLEEAFKEKENNIITESSLYGSYLPLILNICCDNTNMYKYSVLRRSAILALCKYMSVSQSVCEQHLQLLFTILIKLPKEMHSKSSIDGYATIRNNIIVTIGDLACRFPNSVERYIHHLYSCLRDTDQRVRKNTLLVLSHLVLNDMIKVKANIFEIVRCIVDTNDEISQLSKAFFTKLADKASGNNNPIYNLLPTILSNLSQKSANISPTSFQNIMEFLLSFVKKVLHKEKLVEKLCRRFDLVRISSSIQANDEVYEKTIQEEDILQDLDITSQPEAAQEDDMKLDHDEEIVQQWRNLAFCLTQLSMNDKCIQIMISENCVKCYKKALIDFEVYDMLSSITAKFKKTASTKTGKKANSEVGVLSPELKDSIEEWEKQIRQTHLKMCEESGVKSKLLESDDDENDDDDDTSATENTRGGKKVIKRRGKKTSTNKKSKSKKGRKTVDDDEEEEIDFSDEDEDDEEAINELLESDGEDAKDAGSDLELFDSEDDKEQQVDEEASNQTGSVTNADDTNDEEEQIVKKRSRPKRR
ncbi:hypothetical protein C9374_000308 [Naegleria lovaniensis]|uniref:Condensin complex subunit 1 n=1 Tax=Naegleria lovaniensis TaxID=51637 RepID=A0AA88KP96_NAELO|nr:uncharacterized protein C9374_000308 [Naegleria lovaniensis]KAG2388869.1 hypothetical protein C9374_000308 [Naegleria lovaniensis]